MNEIAFSSQQQEILDFLRDSRRSLMITGVAGCGKSTIVRQWLKEPHPGTIVVAPTGVAALNVGGSTIHRVFGFHPNMNMEDPRISIQAKSLLYTVDTIVIDEISMVRADLLGAMDLVLRSIKRRREPFGGVRLVMVGDFWQLPPVVREEEERWMEKKHGSRAGWVFFAPCFEDLNPKVFFLEESFRQAGDAHFVQILNDVRNGRPEVLGALNELGRPPEHRSPPGSPLGFEVPRLCARRADVARYNTMGLQTLSGPSVVLEPTFTGDVAKIPRDAKESLVLAEGARVMITRNGSGYVNGSLGTLTTFDAWAETYEGETVQAIGVRLDNGTRVAVPRDEKEVIGYEVDPDTSQPHKVVIASVGQYPLMLGYSWTIHKSQGQTLDDAVIDLGRGAFAHGQTYVAVSRLRSSQGLYLASPLSRSDLLIDPDVPHFFHNWFDSWSDDE